MATVMQLCGRPLGGLEVAPHPQDGRYLKDVDFEANDGRGEVEVCDDWREAKQFADAAEAMTFLKTSPKCRPIREDGKPNRPLTATNWSLLLTEYLS